MPVLIDHLPITVLTGLQSFGPVAFPDSAATLTVRVARMTTLTPLVWPDPACGIALQVFESDGAGGFQDSCGIGPVNQDGSGIVYGAHGGIHVFRDGTEATENVLKCPLLPGAARQLKATVAVVLIGLRIPPSLFWWMIRIWIADGFLR